MAVTFTHKDTGRASSHISGRGRYHSGRRLILYAVSFEYSMDFKQEPI